jgi:hypothetical protein
VKAVVPQLSLLNGTGARDCLVNGPKGDQEAAICRLYLTPPVCPELRAHELIVQVASRASVLITSLRRELSEADDVSEEHCKQACGPAQLGDAMIHGKRMVVSLFCS